MKRSTMKRLATMAELTAQQLQSYLVAQQEAVSMAASEIKARGLATPAELEELLGRTRSHHPGLLTMLVADRAGDLMATSPDSGLQAGQTRSVKDRAYFQYPLSHGTAYISDSFLGRGFGSAPIVAIAVPLENQQRQLTGVLEASLDLARFAALQDNRSDLADAELVVLDGQYQVVYATNQKRFPLLSDFSKRQQGLEHVLYDPRRALTEGSIVGATDSEDVLCASRKLQAPAMVAPWTVLVFQPAVGTAHFLWDQARFLVPALTIGLFITLVGVAYVAMRIVAPFQRVTTLSKQLVGGQAEAPELLRYEIVELDELSQDLVALHRRQRAAMDQLEKSLAEQRALSMELERSHQQLAEANRLLETRVAERTEDLRQSVAELEAEVARRSRAEQVIEMERLIVESIADERELPFVATTVVGALGEACPKGCLLLQLDGMMGPDGESAIGSNLETGENCHCLEAILPRLRALAEAEGESFLWLDTKRCRAENLPSHVQTLWLAPVRNDQARLVGLLVNGLHSVIIPTEQDRRLFEAAARLVRFALERENSRRDRQALQDHLQEARRLEAIGTLAAGVAHGFNNLLVPIIGYAEVIQKGAQPGGEAATSSEQIFRAAQRAAALVRQLLAFARDSAPVMMPVDVSSLLGDAVAAVRGLSNTLEVTCEVPAEPLIVMADAGQLEQVLHSVLRNAIESMRGRAGMVRVTARAGARPPGGGEPEADWVALEVADRGCGIPLGHRHRVFEPFFSTKKPEGTGLSLAFAHGCMQAHGGHIMVESEEGYGTTVRVLLRRMTRELVGPASGATPAAADGLSILLVEDDETVMFLTRVALRDQGHQVTTASSGEEALATYSADDQFDVVMTDLSMPGGIDGVELAARLQQARPNLPVLLYSGYGKLVAPKLTRLHGPHLLLAKPFTGEQLAHALAALLGQARGVVAAAHAPQNTSA